MSNRRTKERARAKPTTTTTPRPVNNSRLRQLFLNSTYRGTRLFANFVFGPTVKASTPEEAERKADETFVAETLRQRPP